MTKEVKAFIEKLVSDAINKDIYVKSVSLYFSNDYIINDKYKFHQHFSDFYIHVLDNNKITSTIKISRKYFKSIEKLYNNQEKRRNIENLINSDPSFLRKQKLDKINECK